MIKKLKMSHLRALHATWLISLNTEMATGCDKKQRGDAGNMVTQVLDRVRNIF